MRLITDARHACTALSPVPSPSRPLAAARGARSAMGCCVCGADDFADEWQRWDDHPAQRHWEVLKDLGAGALSQVGWG